jgi:hypothetical protein
MHTSIHKDWFSSSKLDGRDTQHGDLIRPLIFFQNRENELKTVR